MNLRFYITLTFALASIIATADDDLSHVVIKETALTSSVYMLEGAGGNMTALVGPEGTILVDDDFAQMSDRLLAKLKELKGSSPRFIVNTHFHYDHTGGNEIFGSNATIIAATAVRDRLKKEQILWKKAHPPAPAQALPQLTFEDTLTLHLNGDSIRIVHLKNGHTDGDTVVFFEKAKVVAMGDLYFSGMYPIFHTEHSGSLQGLLGKIEVVLSQIPPDAQIVPGHGPLSNTSALKKYRQMILASITTVQTAIRKGQTLEQIQRVGLDPRWEEFGGGYATTSRWLELVYNDLKHQTHSRKLNKSL